MPRPHHHRGLLILFLLSTTLAILCLAASSSPKPSKLSAGVKPQKVKKLGKILLQRVRDEFNSTEDPTRASHRAQKEAAGLASRSPALKKFLLRLELDECCPSWSELTQRPDVQEEQRRLHGKARQQLRAEDLLEELNSVFVNISHHSIDGQEGQSEWQKYYKFYDNVQYYLRLVRVAEDYLGQTSKHQHQHQQQQEQQKNAMSNSSSENLNNKLRAKGVQLGVDEATLAERDFKRQFGRQLKSLQFKIAQDPIMASFVDELQRSPRHFEHYETFLGHTQFGQFYARNISMVRESIQALELVGSHLEITSFPSNLTRPSRVYQMIRSMARELFATKHQLLESVSGRILAQRQDVRRAFREMDQLIASRPDIRMLGDEFGFVGSPPGLEFSSNVRKLTRLLDAYTTNNMTHLTFYNQLSTLPEEFILLGLVVAHEYETKELPQQSRFSSDYYNWDFASGGRWGSSQVSDQDEEQHDNSSAASSLESARRHQSERPFYSRLLFGG